MGQVEGAARRTAAVCQNAKHGRVDDEAFGMFADEPFLKPRILDIDFRTSSGVGIVEGGASIC